MQNAQGLTAAAFSLRQNKIFTTLHNTKQKATKHGNLNELTLLSIIQNENQYPIYLPN